jgi:hypothetical protein
MYKGWLIKTQLSLIALNNGNIHKKRLAKVKKIKKKYFM